MGHILHIQQLPICVKSQTSGRTINNRPTSQVMFHHDESRLEEEYIKGVSVPKKNKALAKDDVLLEQLKNISPKP